MIETPQIIETEEQLTACLHITVARDKIQTVMDSGIQEVLATIAAQNIKPCWPWFTHHFRITPEFFDFDICIPIETAITSTDRVKAGTWPAMKVIRTVYQGDYSGLGEAWGEFKTWIQAHNYATTSDLWERYLIDPSASPNPAEWKTELNQPLIN